MPVDPHAQWRPWQSYPAPGQTDFLWSPYGWDVVEIKREATEAIPALEPQMVNPRGLPPEFNVYGLLWRPVVAINIKFDGP